MSTSPLRAWLVLLYSLVLQILTIGTSTYSFGFFVIPWMQEFGAPRGEIMLALSGFSIVTAVMSVLGGSLIDRKSARTLAVGGGLVFSGTLFGIALAPSMPVVIGLFALIFPISMVISGPLMAQTLVTRHFTEKLGMALGICTLGTSLGGMLVPPLVAHMLVEYSWRTVMMTLGCAGLVLMIPPALLLLRPHVQGGGASHGGGFLKLIRNPSVLLMSLTYLGPGSIFLALLHNVPAYAADLAVNKEHVGFVVAATSLMMAASKFIVGALADRINHSILYFTLLGLIAAGLVLVISGGSALAFSIGVPITGLSMGLMPLIGAMVARRFGRESFGSVMGVVLAVASLGGMMPAVAGFLRESSGSYATAFTYLLALLIPAIVSFLVLTRLPPMQPAAAAVAA